MASKIRVKGEADRISKNAACCLIRRLLAIWVVRNLEIERVTPPTPIQPSANRQQFPRKRYIPKKMPPRELPMIRFKKKPLTKTLFPDKVFKSLPCIP